MNQDEIFRSLTTNAFDFLTRGIAEFDSSAKYSVIHFCAATEMLLKARLMREHWTLIVAKPDQAKIDSFMAGDFISITLDEARSRLRNVANEEISDEAFGCFRALANHRNKMVHFFHSGLDREEKAKTQIVAEHCRAWFHLHRLLAKWADCFQAFQVEINKADQAMKTHRKYLKVKFEALKPELNIAKKAGKKATGCNSCGFKSAIPHPFDDDISIVRCLVCDHSEIHLTINCPKCGVQVVLVDQGHGSCTGCGKKISPEETVSALDGGLSYHLAVKDGDFSLEPANCSFCDGHQTVLPRNEKFFCVDCFEFFDHVEQCEWCQELNTGDMTDSYLCGCNHCDGKLGWEKDD
jgi:hypothetical protein